MSDAETKPEAKWVPEIPKEYHPSVEVVWTADECDRLVRNIVPNLLQRPMGPDEQERWAGQLRRGELCTNIFIEAILNCEEYKRYNAIKPKYRVGHYYSPVVEPAAAKPYLDRIDPDVRALPGIDIDDGAMMALWEELKPFLTPRPFPVQEEAGHRYFLANPAFAFMDGGVLHAMLRRFNPRRVVEVGSGFSSACILDTAERCLREDVELTFIDPRPKRVRELIGDLGGKRRIEVIRSIVQDAPLEIFERLEADDVLFIDSTHVMKTASDVTHELFEILPRLKPGVLVQFHDIFWPFEYPERWSIEENRSWNEVYALRAFLSGNRDFEIVFFNNYFWRFHRQVLADTGAWLDRNAGGGSIWLRRK